MEPDLRLAPASTRDEAGPTLQPASSKRMKPKYSAVFGHPSVNINEKHFVGLTESQLIKTLLEQGVHTVSSITHDRQTPGAVHPVEGREMISIWKQVYRMIQKRKRDGSGCSVAGRV